MKTVRSLTIVLSALVAFCFSSLAPVNPAQARGPACVDHFTTDGKACFNFEGDTWVVLNPPNGAPVTGIHLEPGFGLLCPSLTLRVDKQLVASVKNGGAMTARQLNRGDVRWHPNCVRNLPRVTSDAPQVQAPASAQAAAPTQQHDGRLERPYANPNRPIQARYEGEIDM